jgi:hypothetical protein
MLRSRQCCDTADGVTFHAVVRGQSLTGLGKRPALIPPTMLSDPTGSAFAGQGSTEVDEAARRR